jgi:LPXTG-motif cell wall-anchored protein
MFRIGKKNFKRVVPPRVFLRYEFKTVMVKISQSLTAINQETENLEIKMKVNTIKSKRTLGILSMLLAGALAGSQYLAVAAVGPQTSSILTFGVSNNACTTEGYTMEILGVFPERVTNIAINNNDLAITNWSQTADYISIRIPGSTEKRFTITIDNGQTPMLTRTFDCADSLGLTPSPGFETETGGELPDTASNNYNFLIVGIVLAFVGSLGIVRRKQIQG